MFSGEFNHTIDEKGRIIIPNKFRTLLGDNFTVSKSLDGCLSIYDKEEWDKNLVHFHSPMKEQDS